MAGGTLRSTAGRTYGSSDFSGYGTVERPLTIYGGGALTATLTFASGASLSNSGTISVYGTFDNNPGSSMILSDSSGDSTEMWGGTLKSTIGNLYNTYLLHGKGTVTAPLNNTGTIMANWGGTLKLTGNVTNTAHVMQTADSGNTLARLLAGLAGGFHSQGWIPSEYSCCPLV